MLHTLISRSFFLFLIVSCTVTSHPAQNTETGKASNVADLQAAVLEPGKISFQKIVAANWSIDRGGLINLDDPKAKAAGLKNGAEDIQIYFYVVDHPQFGRYLIDTGVELALKSKPEASAFGWLVRRLMKVDQLILHQSTSEWFQADNRDINAIFLTHMHVDHIMGLPDLPQSIPIYVGHGETTGKSFKNIFVQGMTDKLLGKSRSIYEIKWPSAKPSNGQTIIDFFGDQSLFIISTPGHTPGSMAFVINATDGAHLVVGDTCHTRWGWQNGVTPGSFTEDHEANQKSLDFLLELAASIPQMQVHLGHQSSNAEHKLEPVPHTKI